MTIFGKLLLVSIIGTFALIGSLGSASPWPGFAVAWIAWGWFIWSILPKRKSRREMDKKKLIADILKRVNRPSSH